MKTGTVILILILVVALCYGTRELFPKYLPARVDTVSTVVQLQPPPLKIDTVPAFLTLKYKFERITGSYAQLKHTMDSLAQTPSESSYSPPFLVASLDTILSLANFDSSYSSDTLKLDYNFPPYNTFSDIHIGLSSRPYKTEKEIVYVQVPIEQKPFLGGYPEKMLWFLSGYGLARIVSK